MVASCRKREALDIYVVTNSSNSAMIKICNRSNINVYTYNILESSNGLEILRTIDYLINFNSLFIYRSNHISSVKEAIVNIHPGTLPTYAGIFTYQWAIMNDEETLDTTLHYVVEGLDQGDVILKIPQTISTNMTGFKLYNSLMLNGVKLINDFIDMVLTGQEIKSIKQNLVHYHVYRRQDLPSGFICKGELGSKVINRIRATDYAPFKSPSFSSKVVIDECTYLLGSIENNRYDRKGSDFIIVSIELDEGYVKFTLENKQSFRVRVLGEVNAD